MKKVFIIAEAGVNHNGSLENAKKMINAAVKAKADAVKFQTWKTELLVTRDSKMADYQIVNTGKEETQYQMLKRLELSYNQFRELKQYCDHKGIHFMSTPDEEESATFLNELVEIFKIGSGELTNVPFLRHVASFGKPIILSTGMGTLEEVEFAVRTIESTGFSRDKITLLHANTEYPTSMEDVNLRAMLMLRDKLGVRVGYSDHTLGIEIPIAAVALGAEVIEKHFTLEKTMEGPDHAASLEPDELKLMVHAIRNIEKALGDGQKQVSPSESKNRLIVRKSIVAKRYIARGEVFNDANLTVKRPGMGISPVEWDHIVGHRSKRNFDKDECIEL